MLIILEGMDGTGKSTLARQLENEIRCVDPGSEVIKMHRGVPTTPHPLDEYLTPLLNYQPGRGAHWILDRWHIGERVYPALRGRATKLDEATWWYLNAYVRKLGGLVVRCERDPNALASTYHQRGDHLELTELELAPKLFNQAFSEAFVPQTTHCLECADRDENVKTIVALAGAWENLVASRLTRYVTLVGATRPRYLLLGDVRHGVNVKEQLRERSDRRPAFVPYPATSGRWLLDVVGRDPELRAATALANACDVDDVYDLWVDLGRPRVAALGRNAHRAVERYGLKHGRVPHPQYLRRFRTREKEECGAALRAALEENGDFSRWPESLADLPGRASTPRSSTSFAVAAFGKPAATATSTT